MSDELLPCPFCGAEVDHWEDYDDSWYVECRGCGVKVIQPQNTEKAVEEWRNRRAKS